MKFNKFRIVASPHIVEASCECGNYMKEVSNGLFETALYCKKCENVYELKLIKVAKKKISYEFLEQCRAESSKQTP